MVKIEFDTKDFFVVADVLHNKYSGHFLYLNGVDLKNEKSYLLLKYISSYELLEKVMNELKEDGINILVTRNEQE